MAAPLIAQLGKNFTYTDARLIMGSELLKIACDKVKQAQSIMGRKIVYLECKDINRLTDFYTNNGFFRIHYRYLDKIEKQENGCEYFAQFIKYLH